MPTVVSGIPPAAIAAVLAAALAHASWNAIAHRISDSVVAMALVGGGGLILSLPLLLSGPPAPASRPYLAASVGLHVAYFALLLRSYRAGEFSQAYPIARGLSPVVVTAVAWFLVGERLSGIRLAGVLLVPAGLACLVFIGRWPGRAALTAAAATGLVIAAYTTVDGIGVRLAGGTGGYIGWLMTLQGSVCAAIALAIRRGSLPRQLRPVWGAGVLGGVLSVAAYGLVLWAQTRSPLALVAALRETSIIIGALVGTLIFREPFGRSRVAATVLVVAGIVLLSG